MRMRTLIWMSAPILVVSFLAAHLFFGGDPAEKAHQAALAEQQRRVDGITAAAEAGDPLAMVKLGRLHLEAAASVRNPALARHWFEKAAARGSVAAQFWLGRLFEVGDGVGQDPHKAAEWYRRAAMLGGHRDAEFKLGELYYSGRGVPHDYGKALDWYQRAARRGHPVAQHLLGIMNEQSGGATGDLVQAYTWFTLAMAERDTVLAYNPQYDPVLARERLIPQMNENQIKRAEAAAEAFTPSR